MLLTFTAYSLRLPGNEIVAPNDAVQTSIQPVSSTSVPTQENSAYGPIIHTLLSEHPNATNNFTELSQNTTVTAANCIPLTSLELDMYHCSTESSTPAEMEQLKKVFAVGLESQDKLSVSTKDISNTILDPIFCRESNLNEFKVYMCFKKQFLDEKLQKIQAHEQPSPNATN